MSTSWVVKNSTTGQVLFETFDRHEADKFRTGSYDVIPIKEYLYGLNSRPLTTNVKNTNT